MRKLERALREARDARHFQSSSGRQAPRRGQGPGRLREVVWGSSHKAAWGRLLLSSRTSRPA